MPARTLLVVALLAPLAVAACSNESGGVPVGVTGTSDACTPAQSTLELGKTTFVFKNEATDVNELYVKDQAGKTVGEVENVPTGQTRNLTVRLKGGTTYSLVCKPGMKGDGISSLITVNG